jgi:peroxiredoxin
MSHKALKTFVLAAVLAVPLSSAYAAGPDVGKPAPDFSLTDTDGKTKKLSDYKGKYVVLEWVNHGCPFVKKHYDSNNMQTLQAWAKEKGYVWLSICSSAKGKEGFLTAEEWKKETAAKKAVPEAVLLDSKGTVGKSYDAKTTPHMFVVDPAGTLIYKGAIDDKPTYKVEDVAGARNYVKDALEQSAAGQPVATASTEAYGCSVKYAK